jgi:Flp pilus assembly protein TadD
VPEVVMIDMNQLARAGNGPGAKALVDQALARYPRQYELHQLAGDLNLAGGQPQAAIDQFDLALQNCMTDRQRISLYLRKGQAAAALGRWDVAEFTSTSAMGLSDELVHPFRRAEARANQQDFAGALEDCANLAEREDVRSTPEIAAQVDDLRGRVVAAFEAENGPVEPLVWQLRWRPGDAQIEARLAAKVAEIRAAGDEHPWAELAPPQEIVVEEQEDQPLEPWDGELTDADRAEMKEQGQSEAEFRLARAELMRSIDGLLGPSDAWMEAARQATIRLQQAMRDAEVEVSDNFWNGVDPYWRSGDWWGFEAFCTEQAALHPEPRADLERAWSKAMRGLYAEAADDARIGLAIERVRLREDPTRYLSYAMRRSRVNECTQLIEACERFVAGEAIETEQLVVDANLDAINAEWTAAWEKLTTAAPKGNSQLPYFEQNVRDLTLRQYSLPILCAGIGLGYAALDREDNEAAFAIEKEIALYFAEVADPDLFQARCDEVRGDREAALRHYEGALYEEPLNPAAHLALGLAAEEEDVEIARLHFAAGAGPDALADGSGGARAGCFENRDRLEAELGDASACFTAYAESYNARKDAQDRESDRFKFAAMTRLLDLNGPEYDVRRFRKWSAYRLELDGWAKEDCFALLNLEETPADEQAVCRDILGSILQREDDLQGAIGQYVALCELRPDNPHPYEQLGFARQKLELYDEALADFSKAIELGTDNAFVWMERAEIHAAQGNWGQAGQDANQAGKLASEQGRSGLAIRASSSAIRWSEKAIEVLLGG